MKSVLSLAVALVVAVALAGIACAAVDDNAVPAGGLVKKGPGTPDGGPDGIRQEVIEEPAPPAGDAPKTDAPKTEPKVRVDPRTVLVTNALTAIAAAEKALAEGNKEVATAELAKAKTALEALQKVMVHPTVRRDVKPTGSDNPAGGADNPAGDPNVKSKEELRDELRKNMEMRKLGRQPVDVAPDSK